MDQTLKDNLSAKSTWLRGLYIVLFAIFYSIAEIVIAAVVIFQFLFTLFTGATNARLLEFGHSLSIYVYQIMRYVTYNSDTRPFPFDEWPVPEEDTEALSSDSQ